ncbi:testis-specific Y-encoded-like protein 5 [Sorex fumeus]|uniref:testis-specific Y-encoded-like protein 5 n=1 Tax=Sorex fumeus TaxID=62283 RepID=UPI0024AE758D|nr:testis-specific Y-encoded-like protein 5 [Sorex fumeus]
MSGRSRGRKSARAKGRGKGRHRGRGRPAPAAPDAATDDAAAAASQGPACADGAAVGGGPGGARPGPATATAKAPAPRLAAEPVGLRNGPRGGGRKAPEAAKPRRGGAEGRPAEAPAPGPAPAPAPTPAPAPAPRDVSALEAAQRRLEAAGAQAERAYLRLARKFGRLRLQHLERRERLIRAVPGFWAQALQSHPRLAALLGRRDRELLGHLRSLEVEELGLARLGYRITLRFGRNPFFQNRVLVKEYGCGPAGRVVSRSTPIRWLPGHDPQALLQGGGPDGPGGPGPSFLGWFAQHSPVEADSIVEIINEELWPDPLRYYLRGEAEKEAKAKAKEGGERDPAKPPAEPPPQPGPRAAN